VRPRYPEGVTLTGGKMNPASLDQQLIPTLENGDRLSRAEFERRYDLMSDLKKNGVN